MTDRLALVLGIVVVLLLGADIHFNQAHATVFLAQKFAGLVDYIKFWR